MKDNLIRKIFLAVYVAISVATFYHSAWGFALLAGSPPTDWLQLAGWWFIGGAQAAAIDIGMGAIVYAMLHGWERGWLVKSLFLLAGFSAYSQLVYSTAHAVAYPLGAVPEWLDWLAYTLDARTVLFPLALPGFALIYAFAAKGEFSEAANPALDEANSRVVELSNRLALTEQQQDAAEQRRSEIERELILSEQRRQEAEQTAAKVADDLVDSEYQRTELNDRYEDARRRMADVDPNVLDLFGDDKQRRIIAAHKIWPTLAQRAVAEISGASVGYVSETLNGNGAH